jgi:hypothetical protein
LTHKRKFVYYSGNYDTFVKTKVRALLQNPPPPDELPESLAWRCGHVLTTMRPAGGLRGQPAQAL